MVSCGLSDVASRAKFLNLLLRVCTWWSIFDLSTQIRFLYSSNTCWHVRCLWSDINRHQTSSHLVGHWVWQYFRAWAGQDKKQNKSLSWHRIALAFIRQRYSNLVTTDDNTTLVTTDDNNNLVTTDDNNNLVTTDDNNKLASAEATLVSKLCRQCDQPTQQSAVLSY